MKWRYNSQALGDLRRLAAYYELARRRYGEVFADRVDEFIERILLNPQLYAKVKRAHVGGMFVRGSWNSLKPSSPTKCVSMKS